ncbi:MAG: hypothetical protein Q7K16_03965 [Candidatus Azambacteria bacterium]|nr:hypothetical protein [Candidatus Azambacteria bacterium]
MKRDEILELRKKLNIPLKSPPGFYLKSRGKKILRALIKLSLTKEEITQILNKSTTMAVGLIYSRAGIKRSRPKVKNPVWNEKMDQIMFDGFKESSKYSRGEERNKFRTELIRRIDAARDSGSPKIATWYAVFGHMRYMLDDKKLSWGDDSSKANIKAKVDKDDIIWTEGPKGTLTALKEMVRFGIPIEKFYKYHPSIPKSEVEAKVHELSGVTNKKYPAPFLRGIGRIVEEGFKGEKLNLLETSFDNPFDTEIKTADWDVLFINGANIGIQHSRVIEENPVRRALSYAERSKDAVVFLTGIIDVDLKKAAGPLKALRALFSGRNINVSILDPSYQQEAQRIISGLPDNEVVYETAREVFENLMTGLNKISRQPKPDGKPEYSGKVYLLLGPKEEDLAVAAAYWEVQYFTVLKRNELLVEIKIAQSALARAEAAGENDAAAEYAQKLQELQKQESRTRISNVRVEDWYRFYTKALAFIIRRFEEVIPNCKVIGKGTTHVKIGDKVVEIYIPESLSITDKLLSHYVASYGPKVLRGKFASAVVICSPHALNYRVTAREVDAKGSRGSAIVCVAPVCLDGVFLRNKLKTIIKKAHPIGKLVFNEQFCPGVLRLSSTNGIINPSPITIETLGAYERYVSSSAKAKNLPPPKYIWIMVATDLHIGGRAREYIWCEELEKNLGVAEATFHLLRREGLCEGEKMPIHIYSSNDDGIQGNHFQTHKQPNPHQLSYAVIEAEWQKALQIARKLKTLKAVGKELVKMRDLTLYQFQVRGIDWTKDQLEEVFYRHIEPNIDFFSGVLSRALKAGLIIRGISDFTKVPFDSRNIGVINIGTGNHIARSLDGEIVENSIYAHQIRLLLRTMPRWSKERELLEKLVRDPLYSNRFFAWGTIQAPGGYEWGCDFRDTLPAGVDWNDLLGPTVVNDLKRGNYSRIFENKVTVKTYGDKHFLSMIMTSQAIYLMGPAGAHTDLYGEWGFPPNNTGVVFLGLPAEGPGAGPILLRSLLFDKIKDFIENQRPFDWEKFLPNPL